MDKKNYATGSPAFALIQYEGMSTYDVIQTKYIKEIVGKKSVAKYGGSNYSINVIHKNNEEVILQDFAYQLNSQLPIVYMNRLNVNDENFATSELTQDLSETGDFLNHELPQDIEMYIENDMGQQELLKPGAVSQLSQESFTYNNSYSTKDLCCSNEIDLPNTELTEGDLLEPRSLINDQFQENKDCNQKTVRNVDRNELHENVAKVDFRSVVVPHSADRCKKYFCVYCNKQVTNFGRHLVMTHKNEESVIRIMRYPKGHSTRHKMIEDIRKKGQFLYNTTNLNSGTLMVTRRPTAEKKRTANHYIPCTHCKQLYSILSLRVHTKNCSDNKLKVVVKNNVVESQKCIINIHPFAKPRLAQVLAKCRRDKITELVAFDELCIIYGNKLVTKYKEHRYNFMIRSRLRSIGTFLSSYIEEDPKTTCLRDIFDPTNYDNMVEIINKVAGLDDNGRYKAPSTAYNLGLQLKALVSLYESQCIKERNQEKRADARDLLTLMNDGFQVDINKTVTENQGEQKRRKKVILPSKEDIFALKDFLNEGVVSSHLKLLRNVNLINWKDLAGFTLISLQLFNRRRAGEIERILIKDFQSYEFVNQADEVYQDLDSSLKELASLYGRFYIRGKLNRNVPVLINREMITYIDIILKHRKEIGVVDANPYVFGLPGDSENHLKACDLMRKYSIQCGAPNPSSLRGTELRKQIATACAVYNLPDLLVDDVAKHLGHHVDIHKKIYRQSTAQEIPSIVKILRRAMGDTEDAGSEENVGVIAPIHKGHIVEERLDLINQPSKGQAVTVNRRAVSSDEEYIPSRSPTPEVTVQKKRVSWSEQEKGAVSKGMDWMIKSNVVPSYQECIELIGKSPCLQKRTPPQIKSFVAYQSKKLTRGGSKGVKKNYWTPEETKVVHEKFASYLKEKKLPSLHFCIQVISENPILFSRTPEMLKAYVNNLNRKK